MDQAKYGIQYHNYPNLIALRVACPCKSTHLDLVKYESLLPIKFDLPMKGFCLHHEKILIVSQMSKNKRESNIMARL
jgi:hypothetical protein